jgi:hypothetical protein
MPFRSMAAAGLLCLAGAAPASTHSGKPVDEILIDSRPCVFFTLTGVGDADPEVVHSPYFALAKAHASYAELNALLLTARATGRPLTVITSGSLACGHASVALISMR